MAHQAINSYAEAQAFMARARSPEKGRQHTTFSRWFPDGDGYVLHVHSYPFLRITPDNVLEFLITPEMGRKLSNTVSGWLYNVVPFSWHRVDMGRYRVDSLAALQKRMAGRWPTHKEINQAPELFAGIKFDMATGECLNARPDIKHTVIPEARKAWLSALRNWKRKLKVAARVGAFDNLIAEEKRNPTSWDKQPVWSVDKELDILYNAIKTGDINVDLMRMLVVSKTDRWSTPTSMDVFAHAETIVKQHSLQLRKRFGVFEDTDGLTEKGSQAA